jgi:hypothetical protein
MPRDGAQFIAELFFRARGIAVHSPVEGLDKEEAGIKFAAQSICKGEIELAVQLSSVQSSRAERKDDFIEILSVEDADLGEVGGQLGHHGRDVPRGDAAGTGCEYEACGVGTGIGDHVYVFEIRVAANFDPHGGQACSVRISAGV